MAHFAKLAGYSDNQSTMIGIASTLHDIGLIAFPNFKKLKSKLDVLAESDYLNLHTVIGGTFFNSKNTNLSSIAEEIALYHHENWDGTGYMEGLSGDEIPKTARLMNIIDYFNTKIFDVKIMNYEIKQEIITFFQSYSGKIFDPELTNLFLNNINDFINIYQENNLNV